MICRYLVRGFKTHRQSERQRHQLSGRKQMASTERICEIQNIGEKTKAILVSAEPPNNKIFICVHYVSRVYIILQHFHLVS